MPGAGEDQRPTTAPTVEAAEARFADFAETWRERYPAMIATWERAWPDFTPFLEFPIELRTIVYTANAIESLNAGPVSRSATAATSRPSRQR